MNNVVNAIRTKLDQLTDASGNVYTGTMYADVITFSKNGSELSKTTDGKYFMFDEDGAKTLDPYTFVLSELEELYNLSIA